jgi:NAD(P)-dependent dehydrogenase (short-subunit alcohol dehydrogenase family)
VAATVVNVNTTNGSRPMKGQGGCAASKPALEYATRQLAVDLGARPVRSNTVYCGPMRGPSAEVGMQRMANRSGIAFAEVEQWFTAAITQGRIPVDHEVVR